MEVLVFIGLLVLLVGGALYLNSRDKAPAKPPTGTPGGGSGGGPRDGGRPDKV